MTNMALAEATITYDLSDMVGADFNPSYVQVWVTTNVPGGAIADTDGAAVRIGDGVGSLDSDGTGSLNVWVPGDGSNPASWQTYIHVSYSPRRDGWQPVQRTFGPFTIYDDADLAYLVAEQEVPPTYLSQVTAELQTYVDSATASAAAAEQARLDAEALVLSDLGTTDGQTTALIQNPESETSAALLTSVARAIADDPDWADSVSDAAYAVAYSSATGVVSAQVPPLISAATATLDTQTRAAARARATIVRSEGFSGDSLTDNNGPSGSGFKNYIPLLTRGRVTRAQIFAQGGVTIREWLTAFTSAVQGLAPTQVPGRMSIMLGTNDVGRGGYNINTSKADLIEACDLWESMGALPVLSTIPPRNDSAQANIPAFNAMVKALAAARRYDLEDKYAAIVNGSSGIDAAYMRASDPVHLNAAGYEKVALATFDLHRRTAPIEAVPTAGPVLRKRNLATNGLFASTGGKYNGVPNQTDYPLNWETNANSPATFVTDTQAEGRWCKFGAPTTNSLHQGALGLGSVIPGNRYRVSCLLRLSGVENDDFPSNIGTYSRAIGVEFRNAGGGSPAVGTDTIFPAAINLNRNLGGRVLQFVYEGVAPAGSGRVTLNVSVPIGAFCEVAELELVDLTAQSLG